MAEKESKNQPKELIEATPEEITALEKDKVVSEELKILQRGSPEEAEEKKRFAIASWSPKTELGKKVKSGKIKDIDEVLQNEKKILEPQIIDCLLRTETDLLMIGHARGKFGGGKRRAWRQTQRKTMEGNVLSFSSMAIIGDRLGHVGVGMGKAKETLPSREKAIRDAKLNLIKVTLGFEDSNDAIREPHTIPFKVEGKCGSVRIIFWPAPRGTGLVAGEECKKILRLAGIKDIYSKTFGKVRTTFNLADAVVDALKKTNRTIQK
jgi:small subunit ribosomal protein S5